MTRSKFMPKEVSTSFDSTFYCVSSETSTWLEQNLEHKGQNSELLPSRRGVFFSFLSLSHHRSFKWEWKMNGLYYPTQTWQQMFSGHFR